MINSISIYVYNTTCLSLLISLLIYLLIYRQVVTPYVDRVENSLVDTIHKGFAVLKVKNENENDINKIDLHVGKVSVSRILYMGSNIFFLCVCVYVYVGIIY